MLKLFPVVVLTLASALALQATSLDQIITFNEYSFPTTNGTVVSGTGVLYNVLSDTTGALLTANNGDAADIALSFGTGSAGSLGNQNLQWQSTSLGRYTSARGFAPAPPANNPGSLAQNTIRMTFADHLSVTDFTATLLSLNTAGVAWEYTTMAFLRPDGTYFSAAPVIQSYLSHASINGSPSTGWFVADSKGTVTGVGGTTASGANGANDNLTLTYALTNLAAATRIGGIEVNFYLEDTRGTANNSTNFTASLSQVRLVGDIQAVPEAGTCWFSAGGFVILAMARSRRWPSPLLQS